MSGSRMTLSMNSVLIQQLDDAMTGVIRNDNDIEDSHVGFNKYVADDIQHFLYRDFPDDIS